MNMASKTTVLFYAYVSDPFSIQPGLLYVRINGNLYRVFRDEKGLHCFYYESTNRADEDIQARTKYVPCLSVTYMMKEAPFTEKTLHEIALHLHKKGLISAVEVESKWA